MCNNAYCGGLCYHVCIWVRKYQSPFQPSIPSWKRRHIKTGDLRPDQTWNSPTEKFPVLRCLLKLSTLLLTLSFWLSSFNHVSSVLPFLYPTLWVWFTIHVKRCHSSGFMIIALYHENCLPTFHRRLKFGLGLVSGLYTRNVFPMLTKYL